MESLFKLCSRCGVTRPITDFARNRHRPDGLQHECRKCAADRYREKQERLGRTVREKVVVPAGHKRCPGCGEIKPHSEWHKNGRSRDGLVDRCKACRKERHRRDHLKRTFGLTPEEVAELIASQGGVCAICRDPKVEHIDHDHETGRLRGVLCGPCNMGLGLFKDDPDRLMAAAQYLRRSRLATRGIAVQEFESPAHILFEVAGASYHRAA